MKFNLNEITVKSLIMLFIKIVILLAIVSIAIKILHTVIPVLIGLAVGYGIYRLFLYFKAKKKGV